MKFFKKRKIQFNSNDKVNEFIEGLPVDASYYENADNLKKINLFLENTKAEYIETKANDIELLLATKCNSLEEAKELIKIYNKVKKEIERMLKEN